MNREDGRYLDKIISKLTMMVAKGESGEIFLVIEKGKISERDKKQTDDKRVSG